MIVTASHTMSMGHRLPSYDGICSSPHGHNMTVKVWVKENDRLEGPAEFLDFKLVSAELSRTLADFDHAMIVWEQDVNFLEYLKRAPFRHVVLNVEPTTENIAAYVFWQMISALAPKGRPVRVDVQETAKYSVVCDRVPLYEVRRIL